MKEAEFLWPINYCILLQEKPMEELQELCLEEVLGISKKRLVSIINATKCPTDTESSDSGSDVEKIEGMQLQNKYLQIETMKEYWIGSFQSTFHWRKYHRTQMMNWANRRRKRNMKWKKVFSLFTADVESILKLKDNFEFQSFQY